MPKNELKPLRRKIDQVDQKILNLLNERTGIVLTIGKIKQKNHEEVFAPQREKVLLEQLIKKNKGPFPAHALQSVFREILSASRSIQSPVKVAYLGPEGTFTHLASRKYFGHSTELVPEGTIAKVFQAVESDLSDYGVVPIENSTEGVVGATLDVFQDSSLKIIGELVLPVSHHLLSQAVGLKAIQRIYSHPQAVAQCRNWLDQNLPNIPVVEVESTAKAAERAAEDPGSAAIAGEQAVELYRLKNLKKHIEDNPNNRTRFLILGKKNPEPSGRDKTSILFSVKDEVGVLYKMLEPFSRERINLTKIESRPLKKKAWEYIFFLDVDGHFQEKKMRKAIRLLDQRCVFLKVLGSYPKATDI